MINMTLDNIRPLQFVGLKDNINLPVATFFYDEREDINQVTNKVIKFLQDKRFFNEARNVCFRMREKGIRRADGVTCEIIATGNIFPLIKIVNRKIVLIDPEKAVRKEILIPPKIVNPEKDPNENVKNIQNEILMGLAEKRESNSTTNREMDSKIEHENFTVSLSGDSGDGVVFCRSPDKPLKSFTDLLEMHHYSIIPTYGCPDFTQLDKKLYSITFVDSCTKKVLLTVVNDEGWNDFDAFEKDFLREKEESQEQYEVSDSSKTERLIRCKAIYNNPKVQMEVVLNTNYAGVVTLQFSEQEWLEKVNSHSKKPWLKKCTNKPCRKNVESDKKEKAEKAVRFNEKVSYLSPYVSFVQTSDCLQQKTLVTGLVYQLRFVIENFLSKVAEPNMYPGILQQSNLFLSLLENAIKDNRDLIDKLDALKYTGDQFILAGHEYGINYNIVGQALMKYRAGIRVTKDEQEKIESAGVTYPLNSTLLTRIMKFLSNSFCYHQGRQYKNSIEAIQDTLPKSGTEDFNLQYIVCPVIQRLANMDSSFRDLLISSKGQDLFPSQNLRPDSTNYDFKFLILLSKGLEKVRANLLEKEVTKQ